MHPRILVRLRVAALAAPLALGACATNQMMRGEELAKAAEQRSQYVTTLAHFDAAQIQLGRLARSRSDNLRVRAYGEQLVQQHRQHLQALEEWSEARAAEANAVSRVSSNLGVGGSGINAPVENSAEQIDSYQRLSEAPEIRGGKELTNLDRMEGTRFDRQLLGMIKANQERARDLLRSGTRTYASDPVFASLLAKTEPQISANLRETERLIKRVD